MEEEHVLQLVNIRDAVHLTSISGSADWLEIVGLWEGLASLGILFLMSVASVWLISFACSPTRATPTNAFFFVLSITFVGKIVSWGMAAFVPDGVAGIVLPAVVSIALVVVYFAFALIFYRPPAYGIALVFIFMFPCLYAAKLAWSLGYHYHHIGEPKREALLAYVQEKQTAATDYLLAQLGKLFLGSSEEDTESENANGNEDPRGPMAGLFPDPEPPPAPDRPLVAERVWTDTNDRRLTATLHDVALGIDGRYEGRFTRPDGSEFTLDIGRLSEDDVQRVKKAMRDRGLLE